ncbi:MAG: response regulator, partial [Lachnospiraceae bacterium]|nr:response regulator [Lachnospiraceae bacterium]
MIQMILADDEPVITRGIRKLLDWKALGIEIVGEYEDGRKALEAIVRDKPEIALLDISMPGLTGVEILKECRAIGNGVSVIFISGFQDFEYAKAALQYGAVDYLLKPVIREELLRAIEKSVSAAGREKAVEGAEDGNKKNREEVDYERLIENEETDYVTVYADIVYRKEEDGQMRKLIHFSLFGFLEEYLNETKLGIVFQKNNRIVVVLKGLEREKAREAAEEI